MKNITSKHRKIFIKSILLLVILIIVSPIFVLYNKSNNIETNINNIKKIKFGIVLGAGLNKKGNPNSYLKRRLDDISNLFYNHKINKILITGDNGKKEYNEIDAMNNYLIAKGIPQDSIFADYAGFDTYSSMERAVKIFHIKEAIIVSQYYHLPRSLYIANQKRMQALGYTSDKNYGRRIFKLREWFATIKAIIDCKINRKAKFYGKIIDTDGKSNVEK